MSRRPHIALAAAGLAALAALAAPVSSLGTGAATPLPRAVGKPEGRLLLLQWPGYSDASFAGDFERRTGCRITRRNAASSAEMVELMERGRYDLVAASGDISGTLIARRRVRPVNVSLVPAWRSFARPFRSPRFNTVGGVHYGITVTWTPNQLIYDLRRARPQPSSWRAVYDERFRGKVSVPDNPMQIADAALYLRTAEPRLGIRDPYGLTARQFEAAVALLRRQRPLVGRYWQYASEQIQDFRTQAAVVGAGWPYQAHVLGVSGSDVRAMVPREGATAWADSWLLGARAEHPNCAYLWLRHVASAPVQAKQALFLRESPVHPGACPLMDETEEGSCGRYYGASPAAVMRRLSFWRTPTAACGWGGRADCVPYAKWRSAWAKVVG